MPHVPGGRFILSPMRVIECDNCGALLSAADDEELTPVLVNHMADEHDEELDHGDAVERVETDAYDAEDA